MSSCHRTTSVGTTSSAIDCIDTIPDPETFYEKYIRQRQPVHITSSGIGNSGSGPTTTVSTDVVSDAIVPIILENPNILQYDPFIRTLQRIIHTYKQRCLTYNDDDHDHDNDDDFMEQYKNVEVNVRSLASTRTTSNGNNVDDQTSSSSSSSYTITKANVVTMIPTKMPFHDIYQKIFVERNEQYYMTTPTIPLIDKELGQPDIMTFITRQILLHYNLDGDDSGKLRPHGRPYIPLRPKLFGNLIPMNVGNIWIGCTSNNNKMTADNDKNSNVSTSMPSSSGLHHDYHDNLYCLIHGTKIIQLAPPESIHHMEMMGTLHTLHSNGRIVYHEQIESSNPSNITSKGGPSASTCPIRPDGALASVESILQLELRKEEIETELSKLSSDGKDISENAMEKIELLEEELNIVEEQLLDIEMSGNGGNNNQNMNRLEDCDDANDGYDDEDESEEEGIFFGNIGKNGTIINKAIAAVGKNDDEDERQQPTQKRLKYNHSDIIHSSAQSNDMESFGSKNNTLPPNFVKQYDPTKLSFQTIIMHAGDALYIPAGWFHEVTSIGAGNSPIPIDTSATTDDSITNSKSVGPDGIHMAINYWYHPPDVVDASNNNKRSSNDAPNFHQPYKSKFWQRDWEQRQLDE